MAIRIPITQNPVSCLPGIDFDNIPFGKYFTDHMFIADYDGQDWVDARIVPLEHMAIHPANMTFHYGQAIFEGMKATINGEGTPLLFRPELHIERFNASATRMCMPEIPDELFLESIRQLVYLEKAFIPSSEGSALYIRPFMIAMDDHIGVAASKTYRYIVICLPVGPYYPTPIKLLAQTDYVRAVKGGVGEAKTAGNYAASLMPAQTARALGYHQMLWLDAVEHKFIQEVGTMNIFFVMGKSIVTPETDGCILKGITRATIIDILLDKGYHVDERPVTINEIVEAYRSGDLIEVFGSGTAAVVSHVELISFHDV
ncbi:MAG: branched-chain amino acid aminotransferase, partial [Saprospiraceae bacterium]